MRVGVISARCVGCRICELVCSNVHEGEFRPSKARIQVLSFDETIEDIPIVCQQCEVAPCLEACPSNALSRDTRTGAVIVNREVCIGCGACIEACIVGHDVVDVDAKLVIWMDKEKQIPVKCNLCDGDPQCVIFCPTKALTITDTPSTPDELKVSEMTQTLIHFLSQERHSAQHLEDG